MYEEFTQPDSLLVASGPDSCEEVIKIIWLEINDLCARSTLWFAPREVSIGVIEVSSHTKHVLRSVNIVAEFKVVNLIDVAFIHVLLQQEVDECLRSQDVQLVENSHELRLSAMTSVDGVKVSEHWFQVETPHLYHLSVLLNDSLHFCLVLLVEI